MGTRTFLLIGILVACCLPGASGKSARFELSDGHVMRCDPMSDTVHVDMEVDGVTQKLTLDKSTRVDINAPLMTGRSGAITPASVPMLQTEAMYIDQENKASMKVTCLSSANGNVGISLSGSVKFNERSWVIKPAGSSDIGEYGMEESHRPHFGVDYVNKMPTGNIPDKAVPDSQGDREKRSIPVYNVDVLAVIDFSIYTEYFSRSTLATDAEKREEALTNLKRYFAHIMNGIVLRYNDVVIHPPIAVRLVGYYVAEDENSAPWTEPLKQLDYSTQTYTVNADIALDELAKWRNASKDTLPVNDHAMLFTRYDLGTLDSDGSLSTGVVGYATLAATCGNQSVSLIEESYDRFEGTAATAAHELGHNLGARHDGGDDNPCHDDERFLMWPQLTSINVYHVWYFSECTLDYFEDFLYKLVQTTEGRECMTEIVTATNDIPDVTSTRQGQELTFEQQCEVAFGAGSTVCTAITSVATLCGIMYCTLPAFPGYCQGMYPALGTHCGANSWCQGGQCIHTSDSNVPADPCPLEEANEDVYQTGLNCAQYIAHYEKKQCYDSYVLNECCRSCSSFHTGITGCEWGDKLSVCKPDRCNRNRTLADGTPYERACCLTCDYYATTTSGGDLQLPDSGANQISLTVSLLEYLAMILINMVF